MLRVRSIGGKCEDCGGHVELRVTSWYKVWAGKMLVHYFIAFAFGAVSTYLWLH